MIEISMIKSRLATRRHMCNILSIESSFVIIIIIQQYFVSVYISQINSLMEITKDNNNNLKLPRGDG